MISEFFLAITGALALFLTRVRLFKMIAAPYYFASLAIAALLTLCQAEEANSLAGYGFHAFRHIRVICIVLGGACILLFDSETKPAIPGLFFLALSGLSTMIYSQDLLTLYIGTEVVALSACISIGLDNNDATGSNGALRYFFLGCLSSCFFLFGTSVVYGCIGSLQFDDLVKYSLSLKEQSVVLRAYIFGFAMILASLCFKIGLFPFHAWIPGTYQGASSYVTTFIATCVKIVSVLVFIRLFCGVFQNFSYKFRTLILVLSLTSCTIGTIGAMTQENVKKMLGYSSIGHLGYAFLAAVLRSKIPTGSMMVGYVAIHIASLFPMLAAMCMLEKIEGSLNGGREQINIASLDSFADKYPVQALIIMISMLSIVGIPPFIGFVGKASIIYMMFEGGMYWPGIYVSLLSVVNTVYCLHVLDAMYFVRGKSLAVIKTNGRCTLIFVFFGIINIAYIAFWCTL